MTGSSAIERALKQDRAVVVSALVAVIAANWLYVFTGAGMEMPAFDMSSLSMASGQSGQMEMSGGMSEEEAT